MESSAQITKTTLQAEGFNSMSHQVHPDAPSDEILGCKSCSVSSMEKLETIPGGKVSQNSFD